MTDKNDSLNYGSNFAEPIITEYERKISEDHIIKKHIDIPKTLFNRIKEAKYNIEKISGMWINDSIIYRVGGQLAVEGISHLIINHIHTEEELLKELRNIFDIVPSDNAINAHDEVLYSQNIKSILGDFRNNNYTAVYTQKLVKIPFSQFVKIRDSKIEIQKCSGGWISENIIFRVGINVLLDILPLLAIINIKNEDELLTAARAKIAL